MSFHYNYAKLGTSCQTNFDVLTDNTKFLPLRAPVYDILYTQMYDYPGPEDFGDIKPEPLKEEKDVKKPPVKGCCGRK